MVSFTQFLLASTAFVAALTAPVTDTVERDALPDFEVGPSNLARRQDYVQNYKTSGNVNFQSSSNGYQVTFSGAQDFVVGKGWSKGTSRYIPLSFCILRLTH
jgi:endo-1,4-beta-xylanase